MVILNLKYIDIGWYYQLKKMEDRSVKPWYIASGE